MTPAEARLTFAAQGTWCAGTSVALALLLRNNKQNGDGRWRVLTPAFALYLLAHACASILNMIDAASSFPPTTNPAIANASAIHTTTTALASGSSIVNASLFITAAAIPVYVVLATRLLTPNATALRPLRFSILVGAFFYLCFALIILLCSVPSVIVLFSFYLCAAFYGAFALIRYEYTFLYHQIDPVCGSRCRRPLLFATVVGMVDFLLPAFGFLAGNKLAVAWLGLVGRVGDVFGFLPIIIQAFRYAESEGRRDSLPLENPWLFWEVFRGSGAKRMVEM